jgi:putative nucleotidyltransferase with HDIG domain/PAS domain S-box-containing protein
MSSPESDGPLEAIRSVLDAVSCGAILVHRDGRVVHSNEPFAELARRPAGEIVGRDVRDLYTTPDDIRFITERMASFDLAQEHEFHIERPNGTRVPVTVTGRPLSGPPPLPDHRVITVVEITRLKEAHEERDARYREMARLSDTVISQAIELKHYSTRLEERVRERTRELHEANMESVFMLAVASEAKDEDTGAHVRRIQALTEIVARELGLSESQAEQMGVAAILHDVGKIHVPDHILKKPGRLTDEERAIMQDHTVIGERILSKTKFFEDARRIARSHHENWDGSGYPDARVGDATPLSARIVHAVDVFDALISPRVYKPAWHFDDAADWIREHAGRWFDPEVVAAMCSLVRSGDLKRSTLMHGVDPAPNQPTG